MVVARSWAEQRVLMRAFSSCDDQTRPTIRLHGDKLAIGPAGTDPHGEWGIHVEPPVDGRAQTLREALELAARRLAGSKGNPPRLQDEVPDFEIEPTNNWAPEELSPKNGSRRATVLGHASHSSQPDESHYEPTEGASMSSSPIVPSSAAAQKQLRKTPAFWAERYSEPELEAPEPEPELEAKRKRRQTVRYSGLIATPKSIRTNATVHGFSSQRQSARRIETFASITSKTMPLGLKLEDPERRVLNALGTEKCICAADIGRLILVEDPVSWMNLFMDKLSELGLEIVAPGEDLDGEPTYILI